jgi:UDPglucose 6-dehydrogenase
MRLGIVGLGVIGRAIQECADCPTVGADKDDPLEPLLWCDAISVCVGTPQSRSGACDTEALDSVLTSLWDYQGLIVCHSTAPATFYKRHARPNLVHVPEFVRGAHAADEYRSQRRLLIGGEKDTARLVFEIWREWICPDLEGYVQMSIASAAVAKYTANSLLATKVGLLNEIKPLCDAVGADWDDVTRSLESDPRLGNSHWQVPGPDGKLGYGGACFPKDMAALVAQGDELGCGMTIAAAVQKSNEAIRAQ